ncbi:MAG: EAL domain-containing protein [Actinomycetota bacterium]
MSSRAIGTVTPNRAPGRTATGDDADQLPTVLFVDDEPLMTRGLRISLRSAPFDVVTANSAKEGMELLERLDVVVVVSDEHMPGTGGAEFLAAVRDRYPGIRRILLTGKASVEGTIAAVNEAGVFRVLTKPCPTIELRACVVAAIEAGAEQSPKPDEAGDPEQLDLHRRLDDALAGLRMAYQPIYSPGHGGIFAYEALLRSAHPELTNPPQVIEAATALGRQGDLDGRVCDLVAAEIRNARHDALIFVNLLPESLDDDRLLGSSSALLEYADRVGLEVTERVPLEANGGASRRLEELRDAGFRLVLDDLGAGYSGLNSFATVSPDVVKFDMELVRGIETSETRTKLVSSMVALCRDLDILTVAEGVETSAEFEHLLRLGCDLFQGYFIARPAEPWAPLNDQVLTLSN